MNSQPSLRLQLIPGGDSREARGVRGYVLQLRGRSGDMPFILESVSVHSVAEQWLVRVHDPHKMAPRDHAVQDSQETALACAYQYASERAQELSYSFCGLPVEDLSGKV